MNSFRRARAAWELRDAFLLVLRLPACSRFATALVLMARRKAEVVPRRHERDTRAASGATPTEKRQRHFVDARAADRAVNFVTDRTAGLHSHSILALPLYSV